MKGGTTFHFVTDGIHSALEQAKAAAGDKDIRIGGGSVDDPAIFCGAPGRRDALACGPYCSGKASRCSRASTCASSDIR